MTSLVQTLGMSAVAWAPRGYREMMKLQRYHHLSMRGVRDVKLSKAQLDWTVLHDVNDGVNHSALYATEQPGEDVWGPWKLVNGLRTGDCEDYAIHKLQRLVAQRYPRGALRLAICHARGLRRVYHCVLLVYLSDGDAVILDNRTDGLWLKSRRPEYTWVSEEWPGRDFWWRKLS